VKCPEGYGSNAGDTQCYGTESGQPLRQGYTINGVTVTKACNTSQYFASGTCLPCPTGQVSTLGGTSCSACPAGTYANNGFCKECNGNEYTSTSGQTACSVCAAGSVGSGGNTTGGASIRNTGCASCDGTGTDSWAGACGCSGATPYVSYGVCVECRSNSHCSAGKICSGNACVCPTDRPIFTGTACVACQADANCPQGQVCRSNSCVNPTAVYSCPDATVRAKCKPPLRMSSIYTNITVSLSGSVCTTGDICDASLPSQCSIGNVTGQQYTSTQTACTLPATVTYV
jgi:Cys-rich repeat protein